MLRVLQHKLIHNAVFRGRLAHVAGFVTKSVALDRGMVATWLANDGATNYGLLIRYACRLGKQLHTSSIHCTITLAFCTTT